MVSAEANQCQYVRLHGHGGRCKYVNDDERAAKGKKFCPAHTCASKGCKQPAKSRKEQICDFHGGYEKLAAPGMLINPMAPFPGATNFAGAKTDKTLTGMTVQRDNVYSNPESEKRAAIRAAGAKCEVIFSMRFNRDGPKKKEAALLQKLLKQKHNISCYIASPDAGVDIEEDVTRAMNEAKVFVAFGTPDYAENTGNTASTFKEVS